MARRLFRRVKRAAGEALRGSPVGLKVNEARMRGTQKQIEAVRMVRAAQGVADKGNQSDPLFRARRFVEQKQFEAQNPKKRLLGRR